MYNSKVAPVLGYIPFPAQGTPEVGLYHSSFDPHRGRLAACQIEIGREITIGPFTGK